MMKTTTIRMRRLLLAALFCVTAFAADVNFMYFPTGPCPIPGAFWCPIYDQTAGVIVMLTPEPGTSPNGYTITVNYTNSSTALSGTITGSGAN